jgi:hypothetical protein
MRRRWQPWLGSGTLLPTGSPQRPPELLASPDHSQVGDKFACSAAPVERAALESVIARANGLGSATSLAPPAESRQVFLTDSGGRRQWLAPGLTGAVALARPATCRE